MLDDGDGNVVDRVEIFRYGRWFDCGTNEKKGNSGFCFSSDSKRKYLFSTGIHFNWDFSNGNVTERKKNQ